MRMELFEPCISFGNLQYEYTVKKLTYKEVMQLNAHLLNMETDEFVFRDFNKIRDSFWFYDNIIQFAPSKKHNFDWIR